MRALLAAALAPLALSGCINWQGSYDNAARSECQALIDVSERQACLARVEENSRQRRSK